MKRTAFAGVLLAMVAGLPACTSVQVKPVGSAVPLRHLCIQENPRVTVPGFVGILQEGIQRNGLTSQVFTGSPPPGCAYVLSYTALRSWDLGTYLSHAELRIDHDGRQIAAAEYHLRGKGGLALNKWKSAESKMAPVIDELLAGAGHRAPAAAAATAVPAPAMASPEVPAAPRASPTTATGSTDTGPVLAYEGDPADTARTLAGMRNCVTGFQPFSNEGDRRVYAATCWGNKKLLVACEAGQCRELR